MTRDTSRIQERWVQGFALGGGPGERDHLEEPNIDGNENIKMDHQEVGWEHGLD